MEEFGGLGMSWINRLNRIRPSAEHCSTFATMLLQFEVLLWTFALRVRFEIYDLMRRMISMER